MIVGVAGGEYGIRGFIDAYDAQTGKRAWRFYTIPGPGEPGNNTWAGDSWKRGGTGVWVTGAYDPEQNLLFYGTGNPGPDYHSESREGDNLYSDSLVALDADTGKLRWHYQFTPHDVHDWDSTQVPILADLTIGGQPRKVVMFANRNGFYYTLDRTTGKVIVAKPFVHDHVGEGDRRATAGRCCCRATRRTKRARSPVPTSPAAPTSGRRRYDPRTRLFFVNAREVCATYYAWKPDYTPGDRFTGGAAQRATGPDKPAYRRAARHRSGDRRAQVGVQLSDAVARRAC